MSIDIKSSIDAADLDAATFVTSPKWTGSVVFKAGAARGLGFMVGYDPMPDLNGKTKMAGYEMQKPEHPASLRDSVTSSTQIRFSAHT
jgi:hypothetical protein